MVAAETVELDGGGGGGGAVSVGSAGAIGGGGGTPMNPGYNGYNVGPTAGGGGIGAIPGGGGTDMGLVFIICGGMGHGAPKNNSSISNTDNKDYEVEPTYNKFNGRSESFNMYMHELQYIQTVFKKNVSHTHTHSRFIISMHS